MRQQERTTPFLSAVRNRIADLTFDPNATVSGDLLQLDRLLTTLKKIGITIHMNEAADVFTIRDKATPAKQLQYPDIDAALHAAVDLYKESAS